MRIQFIVIHLKSGWNKFEYLHATWFGIEFSINQFTGAFSLLKIKTISVLIFIKAMSDFNVINYNPLLFVTQDHPFSVHPTIILQFIIICGLQIIIIIIKWAVCVWFDVEPTSSIPIILCKYTCNISFAV